MDLAHSALIILKFDCWAKARDFRLLSFYWLIETLRSLEPRFVWSLETGSRLNWCRKEVYLDDDPSVPDLMKSGSKNFWPCSSSGKL